MLRLEDCWTETRIDGSAPREFFAPTDKIGAARCVVARTSVFTDMSAY